VRGEERRQPDLEAAVQDVYNAVAGVGLELEALVRITRAYVRHVTGDDPLAGTLYDADEDDLPRPPDWVNG
jgi:hypothetical protein